MNAFECYEQYVAIKTHFISGTYNYYKYNGKMGLSVSSFEKRNDKPFFKKLAKSSNPNHTLIACLSHNPDMWIGDIAVKGENLHKQWSGRLESLATYTFQQDILKLPSNLKQIIEITGNSYPTLLSKFLSESICYETFTILLELTGTIPYWNIKLSNDPIWAGDGGLGLRTVRYKQILDHEYEYPSKKCVFMDQMKNYFHK